MIRKRRLDKVNKDQEEMPVHFFASRQ